jgi:hypothetical protein
MASTAVLLVDWSGRLLLALACTVILGSESHRTCYHILLYHDSGSHATLFLQYSQSCWPSYSALTWTDQKTLPPTVPLLLYAHLLL